MTSPSPLPDLLREQDGRHPFWLRLVFLGAAVVCLVLGVVGWLIPVITGIPFYAAGLVFLGLASDRVRRFIKPHGAQALGEHPAEDAADHRQGPRAVGAQPRQYSRGGHLSRLR
jgi:hypothetical protein